MFHFILIAFNLKHMTTSLWEIWDRYKVPALIAISFLLFVKVGDGIRWLDFTAAPIDAGILTVMPLVSLLVLTFVLLTNLLVAHYWPVLAEYAQAYLERTFKAMAAWQKVAFYMAFYLGLLYAFVLTLAALL